MSFLDRVLNRTQKLPKFVDPATHASLDYLTAAYFLVVAGVFWGRHRRASAVALINGIMVLGSSVLTDYPGGLKKISFREHGKADVVQMLSAAGLPILLWFADRKPALPFLFQAAKEFAIISVTDFDAEPSTSRTTRAA